jgi:hypothetical protein
LSAPLNLAVSRTRDEDWTLSQLGRWSIAQIKRFFDAGQTRLWLAVTAGQSAQPATTLLFGSAVLPVRPSGKFGFAFHPLLGFHQVYSKLLLPAAAKRLAATAQAQNAA